MIIALALIESLVLFALLIVFVKLQFHAVSKASGRTITPIGVRSRLYALTAETRRRKTTKERL